MVAKKVLLSLENKLYQKAKDKSKKNSYKNLQDYIIELIRRDIFTKRIGGRPKNLNYDERLSKIYAKDTSKSKKLARLAAAMDIG